MPKCNNERMAICKVRYENKNELILVAFHLDQDRRAEEIVMFQEIMVVIQKLYGESDIVVFTDLNTMQEQKKFRGLQEELLKSDMQFLIPETATRKGYAG